MALSLKRPSALSLFFEFQPSFWCTFVVREWLLWKAWVRESTWPLEIRRPLPVREGNSVTSLSRKSVRKNQKAATRTEIRNQRCSFLFPMLDASHVALESVESRGQHVGVRPDGCVKPPNHTGTGHHGQFRVSVHSYAVSKWRPWR